MPDESPTLAQTLKNWWGGLGQDMAAKAQRPGWGETQWRGPEGYNYLPFPQKGSDAAEAGLTGLAGLAAMRAGRFPEHAVDLGMARRLGGGDIKDTPFALESWPGVRSTADILRDARPGGNRSPFSSNDPAPLRPGQDPYQIETDPYVQATIDQQWADMARKSPKSPFTVD